MQQLCNIDNKFVTRILFFDGATFNLHENMNEQNHLWFWRCHTPKIRKVNIWCSLIEWKILGPYFFEGARSGARYLDYPQSDVIPALGTLYPNPQEGNFFQRDFCPTRSIATSLRCPCSCMSRCRFFRYIGRNGLVEWPARLSDLTSVH